MEKLCCDVCGGTLEMQDNGTAVCEFCGMKYSLASLRSKAQEIYGTVKVEGSIQTRQTGTQEDIAQWHTLLDRYLAAFDYATAESVAKKILEADPSDETAGAAYENIQSCWRYLEIKNGVLVKYTGNCKAVRVPDGVVKIGGRAFFRQEGPGRYDGGDNDLQEITLPDSVTGIEYEAFLSCKALQKITFGCGLETVKFSAFEYCYELENLHFPENLKKFCFDVYGSVNLPKLKSLYIPSQTEISAESDDKIRAVLLWCEELTEVQAPERIYNATPMVVQKKAQQEAQQRQNWVSHGCCQHCGGKFKYKGIFSSDLVCSVCGKPKDYKDY